MIKEVIIFFVVVIILSFLINNKLNRIENFESDSMSYLSNGTVTKLFGIQKFKMSNDNKEYLIFNGKTSHLKIPGINSNNFVLTFKFKSSKKNNFLLSGSYGELSVKITDDNLHLSSPLLDKDISLKTKIELDKPYILKLGCKKNKGFISLDNDEIKFSLNDDLRTNTIVLGKDFTSSKFFEGEITDISLTKEQENSDVLFVEKEKANKCNWTPVGITKQECVENCELFEGCQEDKCREICYNCDDEGKCEWLKNQCNYKASGDNYTDCVYKCIKNKNCSWESCVEECVNCKENCPWIQKQNEDLVQYYEPPKKNNLGAPSRPRIRVETSTGMVSIYWSAPDSGDAPIETYIYFLYKTFKKNEGVKIGLVPFPKCRNCFHVIDNLNPNETYSVGIRAYNSLGGKGSLSEMSNIETFKPKLERVKNDIGLVSLETLSNNDSYMNNYHYCNN